MNNRDDSYAQKIIPLSVISFQVTTKNTLIIHGSSELTAKPISLEVVYIFVIQHRRKFIKSIKDFLAADILNSIHNTTKSSHI